MNLHYLTDFFVFHYILLLFFVKSNNCSFKERINVHKEKIQVTYKHQLKDGSSDFQQTVDTFPFHETQPQDCSNNNESIYCIQWFNFATFQILKIDENCEEYLYQSTYNLQLTVTFNIENIHLYGGRVIENQAWPIESNIDNMIPFVSISDKTLVLEPYWLTSNGFYVYVKEEVPLFVTLKKNENIFRIIAKREYPYIRSGDTVLKYKVCKFDNMKLAHEHAAVNEFGIPKGIPDTRMITQPIWTTWAKFHENISQNIVLEYANNITQHGYPNSQLEIDDKWQVCYGSLTVDETIFPDMKKLVNQLKIMGYRVTLWVHPFINTDCEPYFSEAKKLKYFVTSTKNSIETKWWHGTAGHIDFTNPEAAKWWTTRLNKLREEYGIDSFKFDAGESGFNPQIPVFSKMQADHPETNLKAYINVAASFGNMIEVRSARGTHEYPIFVRMMDLNTKWKGIHSLSTMIPVLLHMNIIGYPFVLPDMIGGYMLEGDVLTKEIFIRWLQVNTFMPTLQFSHLPWDLGEDVNKLAKKFVNLHIKYAENIIKAMKRTTETGSPVNPPIWWLDPTDVVAQTIDNEFLVGEDILIAPVMEEGARSRDIYLPKGMWKDEVIGDLIKGPIWLRNYSADLDILPYFSKINSSIKSVLPNIFTVIISVVIIFSFNR